MKNLKTICLLFSLSIITSQTNFAQDAKSYHKEGLVKLRSWDFQSAIEKFNRAIELDPKFDYAYTDRGMAKYNLKDFTGASADYTKAIEINPNNYIAYYFRGLLKYNLNDQQGSMNDFNKSIELSPLYASPYLTRGIIKGNSGDKEGALKDFFRAIGLKSSLASTPALFKYRTEIDDFLQTIKISDMYRHKADSLYYKEKYIDAIELYVKFIETEKSKEPRLLDLSMGLNKLATSYYNLKKYSEAIDTYNEEIDVCKKSDRDVCVENNLNNIATIYYYWGKYDEALKYYADALNYARNSEDKRHIVKYLNNMCTIYNSSAQYEKALKCYPEILEINRELGDEEKIALTLNNYGMVHKSLGHYDEALKFYEESLTIARKLEKEDYISTRLNNIGAVYSERGQYESALKYFQEAFLIDKKNQKDEDILVDINNIGTVYFSWGKYDKAAEQFENAVQIAKKIEKNKETAIALNNVGMVYNSWGSYDKAIKYYEESLGIARELGIQKEIATSLHNIGLIYNSLGQDEKALKFLNESLDIFQKLKSESEIATILNSIGGIYGTTKQFDKELEYYEKALAIVRGLRKENDISTFLSNIGLVNYHLGNIDKAIKCYEEAIEIALRLKVDEEVARNFDNLGGIFFNLKEYSTAANYFNKSISIKEKLRLTAFGDIRRDYLASTIFSYQHLISTYIRSNKPQLAFETAELSRAKYLVEQIAGADSTVPLLSIKDVQDKLGKDISVIIYANTNQKKKIILSFTNTTEKGIEISDSTLKSFDIDKNKIGAELALKETRGTQTLEEENLDQSFEGIINYYRNILKHPSKENEKTAFENGRKLYDFLIKPIEETIKDKKELIIVPDGVLGLLPFETLIDENGKYLIEKYKITYTQSMSVLQLINNREYKEDRRPLIAFGGAVYDIPTYKGDTIENEKQLAYLKKNVYASIEKRGSVKDAYSSLGFGSWNNLPGTLSEVNTIGEIIPDAKIVKGNEVTETAIKTFSENGELEKYKVVHFATHGLVVPEIPELSAIVLSQTKNEGSGEDGYLRMGEIAKLRIKADFVNLSACETGLGKIFNGEGVVGLTQSFLIAGANGLSVSLWQVADESTALFMSEMYKLVKEKEIGYSDSMSEIKRRFIKGEYGDKYKPPFYWAPFVYYGK